MPTIFIEMKEEDLKALATLSADQACALAAGGCNPIVDVAIGVGANFLTDGIKAAGEWLRQQNNFGESPFQHGA